MSDIMNRFLFHALPLWIAIIERIRGGDRDTNLMKSLTFMLENVSLKPEAIYFHSVLFLHRYFFSISLTPAFRFFINFYELKKTSKAKPTFSLSFKYNYLNTLKMAST